MARIVVLGAGMMGTACASHLTRCGHDVNLWGTELDGKIIDLLKRERKHLTLQATVPSEIKFFRAEELKEAMKDRELVVIAVISHAVGKIVEKIVPFLEKGMIIINVAKGIPEAPYLTLCDLIENSIPSWLKKGVRVVGMGGPARAGELVSEVYTEVIFAAKNREIARHCVHLFSNSKLRAKATSDLVGVELCAAMKNAYAIAVGMCEGVAEKLEMTMDNTKAAFMAQAITEMSKFIVPCGGNLETVMGTAGVGDLYVTVQGGRNGRLGRLLGLGMRVSQALEQMKDQTVEGYTTCQGMLRLAKELERKCVLQIKRDLPLFVELYEVLYCQKKVERVIKEYWG